MLQFDGIFEEKLLLKNTKIAHFLEFLLIFLDDQLQINGNIF